MIPIRYNQSPRPWCEIHKCASGGLCCREKFGKFQMTWFLKAAVFRYPAHSLQEKVLLETDVAMRSVYFKVVSPLFQGDTTTGYQKKIPNEVP